MKKLIFSLCAVVALILGACEKYDDGPLTNRVDNLEQRVSALETLCKQMNTNIASLQTLVDALQQNDAITSVTPVYEGSEVVGYTISFVKNPSITIYSSDSGNAPVMGIKQDGDGHYYWTLNNGWLMDSDGNKVSAEWVTGNNGILPQFKIENENWYLSLDNGQTWVPLSNMEGSNGNAMFRDIDTSNPDFVVFILADGTELKVAKVSELSIVFEEDAMIAMAPNSTRNIGYTILGDASSLCVEVLSSGKVKARINDSSSSKGILTITTGSTIDEYDKVILLASNGHTTVMSSISFVRHVLTVTSGTIYEVSNAGGVIDINVETNTEYTISIPDAFQNWVSVSGSRAMRQETISLTIAVNEGEPRTATLNLVDKDGYSLANIRINQGYELDNISIPEDMAVAFPDEEFRNYVVENFDINKDGKITSEEALNVEVINTYKSKVEVRSFKG
ncbi:MAG: hypothetical protein K2L99_07475, partial [Muribaculaceae bacterium]|nr:hypothetical protein [Muribaculaceae bacterium]